MVMHTEQDTSSWRSFSMMFFSMIKGGKRGGFAVVNTSNNDGLIMIELVIILIISTNHRPLFIDMIDMY